MKLNPRDDLVKSRIEASLKRAFLSALERNGDGMSAWLRRQVIAYVREDERVRRKAGQTVVPWDEVQVDLEDVLRRR